MNTKSGLTIWWLQEDGHIEVPGIYFYGYWGVAPIPRTILGLRKFWKLVTSEVAFQEIEAEQGNFFVVSIWIKSWPADPTWRAAAEETLKEMIEMGAKAAWCGGETTSWSITELDPTTYGGCIYAAASTKQDPILHSELSSNDLVYLSEDEISRLGFGKPIPPPQRSEERG